MNEDEVEIMVEQNADGQWLARALHRTTGTIKISDLFFTREEAITEAVEGLAELIRARQSGLGQ
ncbi:hypothetical protein MRY87_13475 [bacterium]|nr:hypothetical protein [bacterium]